MNLSTLAEDKTYSEVGSPCLRTALFSVACSFPGPAPMPYMTDIGVGHIWMVSGGPEAAPTDLALPRRQAPM
jgi:hypothetical protein